MGLFWQQASYALILTRSIKKLPFVSDSMRTGKLGAIEQKWINQRQKKGRGI
jgi:hypothetical protein